MGASLGAQGVWRPFHLLPVDIPQPGWIEAPGFNKSLLNRNEEVNGKLMLGYKIGYLKRLRTVIARSPALARRRACTRECLNTGILSRLKFRHAGRRSGAQAWQYYRIASVRPVSREMRDG